MQNTLGHIIFSVYIHFHFAWLGWSVSINGRRKEDINKEVSLTQEYCVTTRVCSVRVIDYRAKCKDGRLWNCCFLRTMSGASRVSLDFLVRLGFSKAVLKTSPGCLFTCLGVWWQLASWLWTCVTQLLHGGIHTWSAELFFLLIFSSLVPYFSNKFFSMDIVE